MANVSITSLQQRGALRGGFGLYDVGAGFGGAVRLGVLRGLGAGCPEGSRLVNGECVCYDGRVWMPDGSRCVSPQSPAYTGAMTWEESMEGQTPDTYGQQELTEQARKVIEQSGLTITCKIDDSWFAGPQGGQPSRVCSISGSPYMFGAYAINLNPRGAITDYFQWKAVNDIEKATGIPGGALRSTPETTALIQQVAETGVVDQGAAAAAKQAYETKRQLQADLVPGLDYDPISGDLLSWKARMAFTNTADNRLIADAASQAPGFDLTDEQENAAYVTQQSSVPNTNQALPSPYTGGYYEGPAAGTWTPPPNDYYGMPSSAAAASGSSGVNVQFPNEMPSWVWLVAAAAGAYMLAK